MCSVHKTVNIQDYDTDIDRCSELVDYMIVRLAVGNLNPSLPESLFPCETPLKFYYWDRGSSIQ